MTISSEVPIPDPTPPPATSPQTGADPSTTDVAKEQAGAVAGTAADAGKHVANIAGDQAHQVAGEVKSQAQDLLGQTREELTTQAAAQQQRVAGGLRALSDEFSSMATNSDKPGIATDLTRQASQHAHTVASWLEDREPGQVLDEVTRFARRKPGTFLALAAGAGLLAGRLGRGLTAANTSIDSPTSGSRAVAPPPRPDDTPTAPLPPLQTPAAGYAAPPQGYAAGQHTADPTPSGGPADSPYTVPPASAPQPGYPQHPVPGAAR
ncbi:MULTISPECIES: hypothetical protein [Nocardiaceae]|uniref:Uncharacterized protein n=1 Tax=Williamsia limnetica TaxID=882452 RepID=A0A318RCQ8_WILLI|nr:hypothetical protein [Williamsia limnetica]PYE11115.1 hypothetical protein DFR67_1427 [Williamsia limnetica]